MDTTTTKRGRKKRDPDILTTTELQVMALSQKGKTRHQIASTLKRHPDHISRVKARISKYLDRHPDMLKASGKLRRKIVEKSNQIIDIDPSDMTPAHIAILQQGRQVSDRVQEIAEPVKRVVESTHEERRHVVLDVSFDRPIAHRPVQPLYVDNGHNQENVSEQICNDNNKLHILKSTDNGNYVKSDDDD